MNKHKSDVSTMLKSAEIDNTNVALGLQKPSWHIKRTTKFSGRTILHLESRVVVLEDDARCSTDLQLLLLVSSTLLA